MTDHLFGGEHTEIKLKIINKYLSFYTAALKNNKWFNLIYIDSFAGTGERVEVIPEAPLLGEQSSKIKYRGSAQIALQLPNPFNEYHFIEKDKKRFKRLEEVIFPYTSKLKINSYNSDANEVIPDICTKVNWKKTRAVLFLDPYGLSVEWKTLETIKNTNSIDVWYLFPTFATYRNISNTPEETELYKQKKITTLLGTEEWKNHAFGIKKDCHSLKQFDLMTEFADHKDQEKLEKIIGVSDLEVFVKERLGALFPYVTEPLPLLSAKGLHMFSLFMCVSNSSQPAINLAKKVANHILKSH